MNYRQSSILVVDEEYRKKKAEDMRIVEEYFEGEFNEVDT